MNKIIQINITKLIIFTKIYSFLNIYLGLKRKLFIFRLMIEKIYYHFYFVLFENVLSMRIYKLLFFYIN